jgi:CRP-like cAMP-binding protein
MSQKPNLQNIYLFKTMTPEEMSQIAALGEVKPLMMGESIFLRGEKATALYFIKLGQVRIEQSTKAGDAIEVATLSSGSHFGEMAFVDGEPRSATATATDKGEMVVINYDKLNSLLTKNNAIAVKFYQQLALFLCGRLRATTNDLSSARELNITHLG